MSAYRLIMSNKYYHPIASNNFIVFSDDMPWYVKTLLLIFDKDDQTPRRNHIKAHIKSDDYFGTLATVIDLITQEKEKIEAGQNKVLKNLKNDLVYLQKNFKIIRKK